MKATMVFIMLDYKVEHACAMYAYYILLKILSGTVFDICFLVLL
jgi:hypothetical protein